MKLSRLPPLGVAVVLCVAGGIIAFKEDGTSIGASILAAGFVVLGSWLAIEVWEHRDKSRNIDITRNDDA